MRRLLCCLILAALSAPALARTELDQRILDLRNRVRLFPDEALAQLLALQPQAAGAAPLTLAQLLVQISAAHERLNQLDVAASTADQVVAYGKSLHNDDIVARGLVAQSVVSYGRDDLKARFQQATEAEKLALQLHDPSLLSMAELEAGQANAEQGNFPAALAKVQLAVDSGRQVNDDPMPLFNALRALARLYVQTKDKEKAFATLAELGTMTEAGHLPIQQVLLKTSEYIVASNFAQPERARRALLDNLALQRKLGARYMVPSTLNNLADYSLRTHDYAAAARYASEALREATGGNFIGSNATAYANLGQAYLGMGRIAEGKKNFEAALAWFERTESKPDLQSLLLDYGQALEQAGDMRDAVQAYHRERAISNEMFEAKRQKAILELQEKYETDKKQREIALLRRESAIQNVEIYNRRLQQRVWWLLALGFCLTSVAVGLLYRKVRHANARLKAKNLELKAQSMLDPLTSLYNRRHFHDFMATQQPTEPRKSPGHEDAVGVLFLLDIDHFKLINDTYGHAVGDAALRTVAVTLRQVLRETDMIVRWGGEEFLIFVQTLPRQRVDEVAQRILAGIAAAPIHHQGHDITLHVSVGYALFPLAPAGIPLPWERVASLADMALYLAKSHGRNRAYGVRGFDHFENTTMEAIEQDLERAWHAGFVDLSVVVGAAAEPHPPAPDEHSNVLPHQHAHQGR